MKKLQSPSINVRRLVAIARKETYQIFRDPSTLLVAFVLPIVLLFLFAYAVSLDTRNVRIGVVLEADSESAQSLAAAFSGSRYFSVTPARDRREVEPAVVDQIRGRDHRPSDGRHRPSHLHRSHERCVEREHKFECDRTKPATAYKSSRLGFRREYR